MSPGRAAVRHPGRLDMVQKRRRLRSTQRSRQAGRMDRWSRALTHCGWDGIVNRVQVGAHPIVNGVEPPIDLEGKKFGAPVCRTTGTIRSGWPPPTTAWREAAPFVVIIGNINLLFLYNFTADRPLQTAPPCTIAQDSTRQKSGSDNQLDQDQAISCAMMCTRQHNPTVFLCPRP